MAMNDLDFLRQLIDLVDARKDSTELEIFEPQDIEEPATEDPLERDDLFLPPLQAKIEMMKKITDQTTDSEPECEVEPQDAVEEPIKLGRLQQIILSLEEDEPFEG
jgi:hypothetical protein